MIMIGDQSTIKCYCKGVVISAPAVDAGKETMRCKIKTRDRDTGFISESLFDYPITLDMIEGVSVKRCGVHKTVTIRTKAWMGNLFDVYVVCTGIPAEISPTAVCVPAGVAIDRPRTIADTAMSVYTAVPVLTDEDAQVLTGIYESQEVSDNGK